MTRLIPIIQKTVLTEDNKGLRFVKVFFDFGEDKLEVSTDLETGLSRVLVVVETKKAKK